VGVQVKPLCIFLSFCIHSFLWAENRSHQALTTEISFSFMLSFDARSSHHCFIISSISFTLFLYISFSFRYSAKGKTTVSIIGLLEQLNILHL